MEPSTSGLDPSSEFVKNKIAKGKAKCAYRDLDLVWVKIKGHPWWPAYVQSIDYATLRLGVNFFGADEHAFVKLCDVRPYNEETRASLGQPTAGKTRSRAIFEAERYARGEANLRTQLPLRYDDEGNVINEATEKNEATEEQRRLMDEMLELADVDVELRTSFLPDSLFKGDAVLKRLLEGPLLSSYATLLSPSLLHQLILVWRSKEVKSRSLAWTALERVGGLYSEDVDPTIQDDFQRLQAWLQQYVYMSEEKMGQVNLSDILGPSLAKLRAVIQ